LRNILRTSFAVTLRPCFLVGRGGRDEEAVKRAQPPESGVMPDEPRERRDRTCGGDGDEVEGWLITGDGYETGAKHGCPGHQELVHCEFPVGNSALSGMSRRSRASSTRDFCVEGASARPATARQSSAFLSQPAKRAFFAERSKCHLTL
jgi:hypothetical protein